MGYFQLLRELEEEAEREAEAARRAAENVEALDDAAWAKVDEPGFVAKLFDEVSISVLEVRLDVARATAAMANQAEEQRVLIEQGAGHAEPLIASWLYTDRRLQALRLLASEVYLGFARPLTAHLEPIAREETNEGAWALLTLAMSPFDEDRQLVVSMIDEGDVGPPMLDILKVRLAIQGYDGYDDEIVDQLKAAADEVVDAPERAVESGEARYLRREDSSPYIGLITAARKREIAAAVAPLCELLCTFDALEALDALAAIGEASAVDAVERYRESLAGLPAETLPFRLAADNAARALGAEVPVDSAREAFEMLCPKRYGYPKLDDCVAHWKRAADAMVQVGTEDDLVRVGGLVRAPWQGLREAGCAAWENLHGSKPTLDYWDMTRARHVLEHDGPAFLHDALHKVSAVYLHNVAMVLLETGDAEDADTAAQWVRKDFERRDNYWVDGVDQLGDDAKVLVRALRDRELDERKKWFDGTSSAWLRALVLQEEELQRPTYPVAESGDFVVEDFASKAFVYGTHVNGLASSPDGSRLAVVGNGIGRIDDAASGELVANLELRWNWGYDCQFSPDGSMLAVAFHGGHVEIFDAATGERLHELEGHSGVPNGAKRVAFSPDGTTLVSVGQDARVLLFDLDSGERIWSHHAEPGSYEAVAWTPDGERIVASHVKTSGGEENFLTIHDAQTGEVERHSLERSVWAIAYSPDGETVALGGEAHEVLLCDPTDFSVRRELTLSQTTRLDFAPDGRLYGCSSDGEVKRWALASEDADGETLLGGAGPMWALDISLGGVVRVAGTTGTAHQIEPPPPPDERPAHTKQVRIIRVRPDGIYTAGWDGQLLRWSEDGDEVESLFEADGRLTGIAFMEGERVALATSGGLRVIDLATGEVELDTEGGREEVAVSPDERTFALNGRGTLDLLHQEQFTHVTVGTDTVSAIAALPDGWLVGTKQGELSLVRGHERIWTLADHGSDRLERGTPHKDICDLRLLAAGIVTAGNDNTIRVYDWDRSDARPTQRLRIHTYFGIFQRFDVSEDERWLAVPSATLDVYDLRTGERRVSIPVLEHFGQSSLTAVRFVDDAGLLVGTEKGRIFKVRFEGGLA